MIVYFTGTGNSRYCAQSLADKLGDDLVNVFHFIRDGIAAELFSDRPWVFVAPTYGWRLPRIFAEFIKSGSFTGNGEAYFVMTCGSDIGNAAPANRALCEEKGICYKGTLPVVMPENYIALFDAPEQKQAREIIAAAQPAIEIGIACIREGRNLPAIETGFTDRLKSGVVNAAFYRFTVRTKPFAVSDNCTGCGKCAQNCVMKTIRMQKGRPVWGERCTHCMACICGCPVSAIEYGEKSRGKTRYQCPEYEK